MRDTIWWATFDVRLLLRGCERIQKRSATKTNATIHLFIAVLLFSLISTACPVLFAQTVGSEIASNGVIEANARTIKVDVVVRGKDGSPVKGLRITNFEAFENGPPQRITYFEEHAGKKSDRQAFPPLPPNIFTNVPRVSPSGAVTVLLLDILNTQLDDQARVHKDMVKYLEEVNPGQRLAVFTLGARLRCVEGFTDDPTVLREALADLKRGAGPRASPLLESKTDSTAEDAANLTASLRSFEHEQVTSRDNERVLMTLAAFQQLAHSLQGIPGRKNVVWFSSAFPLVLFPKHGLANPSALQHDFGDQVRRTADALASAQVAIYPVAAEGLVNNSLDDTDTQLLDVHSAAEAQEQSNKSLREDAIHRDANHTAMDEIASETGGEATYNSNKLDSTLTRVLYDGANYYTLYYTPAKATPDGSYRKIQLKLNTGNYKLFYRRGYYTADTKTAKMKPNPVTDPLRAFMAQGMPDSTQLPLAMRVLNTAHDSASNFCEQAPCSHAGDNPKLSGEFTRYAVDFVIAAKSLQFAASPDGGRQGKLEAELVVYDRQGKPLNWVVRQVNLDMDAARYAQVQADGVNFRFEIDVPAGSTSLRGGVYDWNSNSIGTLEISMDRVTRASRRYEPDSKGGYGSAQP